MKVPCWIIRYFTHIRAAWDQFDSPATIYRTVRILPVCGAKRVCALVRLRCHGVGQKSPDSFLESARRIILSLEETLVILLVGCYAVQGPGTRRDRVEVNLMDGHGRGAGSRRACLSWMTRRPLRLIAVFLIGIFILTVRLHQQNEAEAAQLRTDSLLRAYPPPFPTLECEYLLTC